MVRSLVAVVFTLTATSCGLVDEAQLTETIAIPTPDPAVQRSKDVAAIFHLAKAGQLDRLVALLTSARASALASPVPGVTPSVFPTLETAPPTPTPTPSPTPTASSVAGASAQATADAKPSASPSASASPISTPSPTPSPRIGLDPALTLALYKVDPHTYAQLFAENYPIDEDGVRLDYGDRLARAKMTKDGTRFPISAIARIAAAGDETATIRLLAATASSSGNLASAYADAIAYVAAKNPDGFAIALDAVPMGVRLRAASTSHWCLTPPKAFLAKNDDDPERIAMAGVIKNAMSGCRALPVRHAKPKRIKAGKSAHEKKDAKRV
jgi:hypothetical protein